MIVALLLNRFSWHSVLRQNHVPGVRSHAEFFLAATWVFAAKPFCYVTGDMHMSILIAYASADVQGDCGSGKAATVSCRFC